MIVYEDEAGAACIGQAAHAWVSGRLARRWGRGPFEPPVRLDGFCLGAEQHDIGMAEADLAPELDPATGWPVDFRRVPGATSLALWRGAPDKVLSQSPHAALLVSMHGRALRDRDDPADPELAADVRAYRREQDALRARLTAVVGLEEAEARHEQRLLWIVDSLALVAVTGWAPKTEAAPTRPGGPDVDLRLTCPEPLRVEVDPWPFGAPGLRLGYPARRLTERCATREALQAALAAAPWIELEVTWAPIRTGGEAPAPPL